VRNRVYCPQAPKLRAIAVAEEAGALSPVFGQRAAAAGDELMADKALRRFDADKHGKAESISLLYADSKGCANDPSPHSQI
jgi:hypothetical protein